MQEMINRDYYLKKQMLLKKNAILYLKDVCKVLGISFKAFAERAGYSISSINRNIKVLEEMNSNEIDDYIEKELSPYALSILFTIDTSIFLDYDRLSVQNLEDIQNILFSGAFDVCVNTIMRYTGELDKRNIIDMNNQEWCEIDFDQKRGFVYQLEYLTYNIIKYSNQLPINDVLDIQELGNKKVAITMGAILKYNHIIQSDIIYSLNKLLNHRIDTIYMSSVGLYMCHSTQAYNPFNNYKSTDIANYEVYKLKDEDCNGYSDFQVDVSELVIATDCNPLLIVRDNKEVEKIHSLVSDEIKKKIYYVYCSKDFSTLFITDGKEQIFQYELKKESKEEMMIRITAGRRN